MQEKKEKRNLWMLVLAVAICIAYMFCDAVGLTVPPVYSSILFIATVMLFIGYISSNYSKRK